MGTSGKSRKYSRKEVVSSHAVIAEYTNQDAIENLKAKHNHEVLKLLEEEHRREIEREELLARETDANARETMQEKFDEERREASRAITTLKKEHEAQVAVMLAGKS